MPQKGDTQVNNFVKGLITEASPLSFPPGASLDEENFKLKRDGSRERRLGLDYEENYTLHDTALSNNELAVYRKRAFVWSNPSGSDKVEIGVIQIGTRLYFVNLYTANPSANLLNGGNYLDASSVSDIINVTSIFDFAILNNNLIVVSEGLDTPFLLSYDDETDTISYETSRVKIRDLYGVEDSLDDDERPSTLTDAHEYNLRNQGWDKEIVTKNGGEVLQETKNVIGVYPSNSDVWSLGKIADVTSADIDKYDAETLKRNSFDLGRAAKGHFIIDLYDRGNSRNTESGIPIENSDRELGRISTVATLGGRIFYSGIRSRVVNPDRSPKLSGAVLFSQIARNNIDLVKCYQEADPTSPNNSDIVDTDGGIIQITEASNIVDIRSIRGSIIVFSENGVWEIRGDDGGFRATSFQVNKISSIGVISRDSIVEANGVIFFWGREGIFSLTPNQLDTGYDTTNVTIATIQSAYNTIPDLSKQNARGYYDVSNNRIRWLFNSEFPVTDPATPYIGVGEAVTIGAGYLEPKVVRLSNTKAMVVYRDSGATTMKTRILTLDPNTLEITQGTEQDIVTSTALGGHSLTRLSSSRVLITYLQSTNTVSRVLNISGDTVTAATAYTVNSVHQSTAYTSPIRSVRLGNGDVVITFINSDNNKASVQVLQIDSSNVVTWGTVGKTTDTNLRRSSIAMLSDTKGVILGDTNNSTRCVLTTFTLSGTTPTISGTSGTFLNSTQMAGRSYTNTSSFIAPIDSDEVYVVTSTSANNPTVSSAMYSFVADASTVPVTSTTILEQDDETGSVPVIVPISSAYALVVYRKDAGGGDFTGRVLYNNVGSTTPVAELQLDVGSDTTFAFPEADLLQDGIVIIVYETATDIKAIAGNFS